MQKLLASTAVVLFLAAPAYADSHKSKTETMTPQKMETTSQDRDQTGTTTENRTNTTSANQNESMRSVNFVESISTNQIKASKLIGMRIYATEKDVDLNKTYDKGPEKDWDDIGEINDVILTRDGQVKAVVLGIGGFLGIGEKDVAVEMSSLKFVKEKDENDFFLVVNASRQKLEQAPAYKAGS